MQEAMQEWVNVWGKEAGRTEELLLCVFHAKDWTARFAAEALTELAEDGVTEVRVERVMR